MAFRVEVVCPGAFEPRAPPSCAAAGAIAVASRLPATPLINMRRDASGAFIAFSLSLGIVVRRTRMRSVPLDWRSNMCIGLPAPAAL
jgi:hypothetical protein